MSYYSKALAWFNNKVAAPFTKKFAFGEQAESGAKGHYEWESRWATPAQARAMIERDTGASAEHLTDEEAIAIVGVPSIDLCGQVIEQAHMPEFNMAGICGAGDNMVVTAGLSGITNTIGYGLTPIALWRYIAVGSSNTTVLTTDTQLGTEITNHGWARTAATVSAVTGTYAGDTLQLVAVFTLTAGTDTVQEICIGNNSAANTGQILTHALTGAIQLPSGAVVTFTYKVTFASA